MSVDGRGPAPSLACEAGADLEWAVAKFAAREGHVAVLRFLRKARVILCLPSRHCRPRPSEVLQLE